MSLIQGKINIKILLFIICIFLLIVIFNWFHYLVKKGYIAECYENMAGPIIDTGSPETSHTVNLPLTTTYSCKNFCGPQSICSITGQQCTADIDCPGCQPYVPPLTNINSINVSGENDAGKLTTGTTPTYSSLTTDIGTQAKLFTSNKYIKPAMANFGVNTWKSSFIEDQKMFNSKYKPPQMPNMPTYKNRYTMTGEFINNDPYAANAYLS